MTDKHEWQEGEIFVFGSNLAGRHDEGAALFAKQHCGAVYGQGEGLQGSSYAIPTKDHNIETLPLSVVEEYIWEMLDFADNHPHMKFFITKVGCGLAGLPEEEIKSIFQEASDNCILPPDWEPMVSYWLNFMGPVQKAWYDEHGSHWAAGRIDIAGLRNEPWGLEYGVGIVHSEDWNALGDWLRNYKSRKLLSKEELFAKFEKHIGRKIRWFCVQT